MLDNLLYTLTKKPQIKLPNIEYMSKYDLNPTLSKTIFNLVNGSNTQKTLNFKFKTEYINNFFTKHNIIFQIIGGEYSFIQGILMALNPEFKSLSWTNKKKIIGEENLLKQYKYLKIIDENYNYILNLLDKYDINIIIISQLEVVKFYCNNNHKDKTIIMFEDCLNIFYLLMDEVKEEYIFETKDIGDLIDNIKLNMLKYNTNEIIIKKEDMNELISEMNNIKINAPLAQMAPQTPQNDLETKIIKLEEENKELKQKIKISIKKTKNEVAEDLKNTLEKSKEYKKLMRYTIAELQQLCVQNNISINDNKHKLTKRELSMMLLKLII
jgi:hypothetical protein